MLESLGPLQLSEITTPAPLPVQRETSHGEGRNARSQQGAIGDAMKIGQPRCLARHPMRRERTLQQFQ